MPRDETTRQRFRPTTEADAVRTLATVTDLGLCARAPGATGACDRVLQPDDLVYEIDSHGHLTHVSQAWNRFAAREGAPELRAEKVIGRRFWSFFDDADGLVEEHRLLLDRCRSRGQCGTFLLRYDRPGERRMMRVCIEPLPNGSFRLTSRTTAVDTDDPALFDHLLRVARPIRFARCSHCHRFRVDEDWFEPELHVRRDWERERPGRERAVVHTLCPSCRAQLRAMPRLVAAS